MTTEILNNAAMLFSWMLIIGVPAYLVLKLIEEK